MSPTTIKYLIAILLASFLFACAAEAQTGKQLHTGNKIPSTPQRTWRKI